MLSLVINLDRSPNRLAAMTAQAERHSLPFQRIRAIDGLALPDDMRAEFLDERGGIASKMIVGEVGCYASHMRAWQRVVADRLPHAMVLEDDVILGLDVVAIADAAVRSCPAGWDLIHLNGRTKKSVVRVAQLDTNHRLIRYTLPPLNSCAYIISQAGARKMLRPAPRMRPIDVEMRYGYLRAMDIYGVSPTIVDVGPVDDAVSIIGAAAQRIGRHPRHWRPSPLARGFGRLFNSYQAARSLLAQITPSTPLAVKPLPARRE